MAQDRNDELKRQKRREEMKKQRLAEQKRMKHGILIALLILAVCTAVVLSIAKDVDSLKGPEEVSETEEVKPTLGVKPTEEELKEQLAIAEANEEFELAEELQKKIELWTKE